MLKEKNGPEYIKELSLYPCDQCTKNFLTLDQLKSHQQRKHIVIREKHESSDDNEKDVILATYEKNKSIPLQSRQKEESQLISNNNSNNRNNNDEDNDVKCIVCTRRTELKCTASSIAIQCEVNIDQKNQNDTKVENLLNGNTKKFYFQYERKNNLFSINLTDGRSVDSVLIRNAYETISDLKKEIINLKKSLEAKTYIELQQIESGTTEKSENATNLTQTNDKIDVIEQKFNAFEVMFMESQHQFIDSFRNLNECQKFYMDNIQETIKEIVEKSFEYKDTLCSNVVKEAINDFTDESSKKDENEKLPEVLKIEQSVVDYDLSSCSEDEGREITCTAEVYTISQNDRRHNNYQNNEKVTKKHEKIITKDDVLQKFEDRLLQFGVEINSGGLPTPRSFEINEDLMNERREIKRAHRSFKTTRKQLSNEVNRIAKEKLASASSTTSFSSDQNHKDESHKTNLPRPKSASVQKMRKRKAKKIMNKFVGNDIDENAIIDKMQTAHEVINSHRQCINKLLETTTHSPSSLTKYKKIIDGANNDRTDINQFNKMPNITTRRVVFVNLDEDS